MGVNSPSLPSDNGARYKIIIYLLFSIIFLAIFTVISSIFASRIGVDVPDVIIGIINMSVGALIAWGGSVIKSFEIGREGLQAARIETEKVEAVAKVESEKAAVECKEAII